MIDHVPATQRIPVIDLAGSFSSNLAERKAVAAEIHAASRDIGFFYVKNHGIPAAMTAAQLELAHEFFALEMSEKLEIDVKQSSCFRGYEPLAVQTLEEGKSPDLKEGFIMGPDLGPDHRYVRAGVPNTGPNQWPRHPHDFKQRMNAYSARMTDLGRHLIACLALSLELPEDYFAASLEEPIAYCRLLHYPPQSAATAAQNLGAGAHTDWGMLTMLLQDDIGGLEVRAPDGEWISATPMPGTFVVNLGEMIPRLTNDLYRSTMHRVVSNTSGRDRYSVPAFLDPEYYYTVKCVPTCLPTDGSPRYPECSVGEHLAEMYRKTYNLA
ncbi:MAG: 2-oxoglutarate and iron-dependent oxygenase domain-containing protein [Candidatus Lustribacter sp.]|jgi:isopenicillin N synthase-like dioxygenase